MKNPAFFLEYGDMSDASSLWRVINRYRPDYIYNAAAMSHVRVSFDVPEYTVDVTGNGVLRLLNVAREVCPEARIVQFSSSEMFGDNPEVPQHELTRLQPASPYACAKTFAHHICNNYRESYGMHIICPILFNNESPRRGETFVTRKITQAAAKIKLGQQHRLKLGNLGARRDWGYSREYMELVIELAELDKNLHPPGDYVLATGESRSVEEFLDEVFRLADLNIKDHVEIDQRLFRPHEVPHLEGDNSKLKRTLGKVPQVTMKELAGIMFEADLKATCDGTWCGDI